SYDLFVFDPNIAPRDRDQFIIWYKQLTKWEEPRDYNSTEGTTENLSAFFDRLSRHYPPMNGPNAYQPEIHSKNDGGALRFWERIFGVRKRAPSLEPKLNEAFITDYSIAENGIYMAFAWSINAEAYSDVVSAAIATGVGFFDVSGGNGVFIHDRDQLKELPIL
ncbi:MAG: hypothetical protein AB7E21_11540, partial [Pseudodonghicola sp.]